MKNREVLVRIIELYKSINFILELIADTGNPEGDIFRRALTLEQIDNMRSVVEKLDDIGINLMVSREVN